MNKSIKGIKKERAWLTKKEIIELAQLAYFDYATTSLKDGAMGNVMPQWDDLFPNQQNGWIKVINTIHQKLVPKASFKKV